MRPRVLYVRRARLLVAILPLRREDHGVARLHVVFISVDKRRHPAARQVHQIEIVPPVYLMRTEPERKVDPARAVHYELPVVHPVIIRDAVIYLRLRLCPAAAHRNTRGLLARADPRRRTRNVMHTAVGTGHLIIRNIRRFLSLRLVIKADRMRRFVTAVIIVNEMCRYFVHLLAKKVY